MGMEAWIDDQFEVRPTFLSTKQEEVHADVNEWFLQNGGDSSEIGGRPYFTHFNYTWWDVQMKNKDLLRQRIAVALTEIFVISIRSELEGYGDGLASYYDIFSRNAFDNYRVILTGSISAHLHGILFKPPEQS